MSHTPPDYCIKPPYNIQKGSFRKDIIELKQNSDDYIHEKSNKLCTKSFYTNILLKRLPIIKWLFLEYKVKEYLPLDLLAGFTVGIMTLPQSMAYAMLANLKPVIGLYMAFFPLMVYTLFGTSKTILVGAVSIISLLTGEVVQDLADDYNKTLIYTNNTLNLSNTTNAALLSSYKQSVGCSLALFVGVVQVLMGISGLGVLTTYFSDSFISGYMCASAFHGLMSQVKDIIGLQGAIRFNGAFKIPRTVVDLVTKLPTSNWVTVVISVICLVYLITFKELINSKMKKRLKFEFPAELALVITATVVSHYFKLNSDFGVNIVKTIPRGFPNPSPPNVFLWFKFIKSGLIISLIAFSSNISLAKTFANKNKQTIDSTQELYAYGITNIFVSFFSCFPTSASLSRSSVLDNIGGKTQFGALFSSALIVVVILWLGPYLEELPKACLACIILLALKSLLFQVKDLPMYWRTNKYEGLSWLITFVSVILLDVDWGLFIGIFTSIILVTIKDKSLDFKPLVKSRITQTFVDKDLFEIEYEDMYPNVKIFKLQCSVYFVNAEEFEKKLIRISKVKSLNHPSIRRKTKQNGVEYVQCETDPKNSAELTQKYDNNSSHAQESFILLDFSGVNYIDTTAVQVLLNVKDKLKEHGVYIYICNSQDSFLKLVNNMGFYDTFSSFLFVSIEDAMNQVQKQCLL